MIKRLFDLVVVFVSLPIWGPVLLLLLTLAWIDLKTFPIFVQPRGGKGGKVFTILKLKTMTDEVDEKGQPLPDAMRITKFGNAMRKLSLDELPSLINVLKGDISLVGPRPFMAEYLPLYSKEQMRRHDVTPGLTGWAQVNGRNTLSWEEKFELDIWYVENQSFWLDIKVLFLTLKKVFLREGVSADGEATMPKFKGTKK